MMTTMATKTIATYTTTSINQRKMRGQKKTSKWFQKSDEYYFSFALKRIEIWNITRSPSIIIAINEVNIAFHMFRVCVYMRAYVYEWLLSQLKKTHWKRWLVIMLTKSIDRISGGHWSAVFVYSIITY